MAFPEYANIIIDISHEKVDRLFQYKIPAALLGRVEVGASVDVPFGRGNTKRKGYVIELCEEPDIDPSRIKEMIGLSEGMESAEDISIRLAAWIGCSLHTRRFGVKTFHLTTSESFKTHRASAIQAC